MKLFTATAAALLATAPFAAKAQITITNDVPMTWQVPSGCLVGYKFASDKRWTNGVCNRVSVSTHDGSHNIRFALDEASITYITSTASPAVVYAIGIKGPDGTAIVDARGACEITKNRVYSCTAITQPEAMRITNVATFLDDSFPALQRILN